MTITYTTSVERGSSIVILRVVGPSKDNSGKEETQNNRHTHDDNN